jgi:hypothetical protein
MLLMKYCIYLNSTELVEIIIGPVHTYMRIHAVFDFVLNRHLQEKLTTHRYEP